MSLPAFLHALWTDGRVRVANVEAIPDDERREAGELLAAWEPGYREELPDRPPLLHAEAATWGAVLTYRACQLALFRQLGLEEIDRRLGEPCPAGDPPSIHYSVDLILRYLPDLWRHAHRASEHDPLVARLRDVAVRWPLSSVGIPGLGPLAIDVLAAQPCLLRMYVDRIIARRDVGRCSDPRIRREVRTALGLFPQLAPEVAAAIEAN